MNIFLHIICQIALTYIFIKYQGKGAGKETDSVGEHILIRVPIRRKEDV